MLDKIDSAIYVIGGPNKVYEALNSKAGVFFKKIMNGNDDFKRVFE